jgi:hypothetical protein
MSYFNAARLAGPCKNGECEENDYIYDAPHLSSNISCSVQGTSYCEIEQKVHTRKDYNADMIHLAPDAWEDRLLSIEMALVA